MTTTLARPRPSPAETIGRMLVANARKTRLGSRQAAILRYARLREAGGQTFPTPAECKAFLRYLGPAADCEGSILGLELRGLVARDDRGRFVTKAGWAVT